MPEHTPAMKELLKVIAEIRLLGHCGALPHIALPDEQFQALEKACREVVIGTCGNMSANSYASHKGEQCPRCHGTDVDAHTPQWTHARSRLTIRRNCKSCECTWVDRFTWIEYVICAENAVR